jgi:hypothetical protein
MSADTYLTRFVGPSPVAQVARDIVRRGVWVTPVMMLIGAAIWGTEGFFSVGYAVVLILANFAIAAGIIATTSRISLSLMMAGVLFGFLIRLAVIFGAVFLVRDAEWMNLVALGVAIVVTHLGLLVWELRFVSLSMAYPGLKPGVGGQTTEPMGTTLATMGAPDPVDVDTDADTNADTNKEHSQP